MNESMKKEVSREAMGRRQLEVEGCLAEYGFVESRRRLLRDASEAFDPDRCRRLSAALVTLGPVFSSFGIYLSSRADFLTAKDCLELASIRDKAEVSSVGEIWKLIDGEIGPPSRVYDDFDEVPLQSGLIFQSHRARLHSGEPVTVKTVHPELEGLLACDLELLSLLSRALPDLPLESAVEDFRYTLKQQTNFLCVAEMMAELSRDMPDFEGLKVPRVHREFCTSRILTLEHLYGSNLDDLSFPFDYLENEIDRAATAGPDGDSVDFPSLASRLVLVWLRQSLQGRMFSVDPRPEHILVLSDQQIAFAGGSFARLPPDVKTNLHDYLVAVMNQDPDKACFYLLREMRRVKGLVSGDEVRHRLRQVVPFRDGAWSSKGDTSHLAEYLFVHWRLARECGYWPQTSALSFFRGLFQIATTARRLAPTRDPLLQGLQDLRMEVVFTQFREMMSLGQMSDNLDKYAAMMTDFPQRLNDVLTLVAESSPRFSYEKTAKAESRAQKNSSAAVIGLLLLLVAVALLSQYASASTGSRVWVDSIGAVTFLMVGALLLRAACRP